MDDGKLLGNLAPAEQVMVALAVLLDGHDALTFFSNDKERGSELKSATKSLVSLAPDLRLPLVGTILRNACLELEV